MLKRSASFVSMLLGTDPALIIKSKAKVSMDENYVSIPAADGCPSLLTPWGSEYAPMIDRGVQCAQAWLNTPGDVPLWWELAQARKTFPAGDSQDAFEAGFLLRVQQRLQGVSP
ncbi:LasR-specific antiactivator QslA [Pseudomonas synxantha]|uniref:LasR-specific antiactivator QslA n=1 Tax=Pseudomonas synxantha TaxID=47883 RepID=UPI001E46623F|nr:LasR-specific antiactivator QslA [Pseudomonas synxantha]